MPCHGNNRAKGLAHLRREAPVMGVALLFAREHLRLCRAPSALIWQRLLHCVCARLRDLCVLSRCPT